MIQPSLRLNLILFAAVIVLVSIQGAAFTYSLWGPAFQLYWSEHFAPKPLKPATKAGDRVISDCLGVSDFYSVHLTTYFLADSDESAGGAVDDLRKYDEYCDHVPGTGKVIFAVTFMEKEVRNQPISLWFYQLDAAGGRKELGSKPPTRYPSGTLSVDSTLAHKGKYLLKIGFGEAKEKEDIIEMPIVSGH
ncbi:MAG TPA: hypothetical protein VMJ31_02460 [Methylocystis sp.]|nr:hypothetical protein [Methylocystis sp.]